MTPYTLCESYQQNEQHALVQGQSEINAASSGNELWIKRRCNKVHETVVSGVGNVGVAGSTNEGNPT